jgi:membrane-bound lytic murein transglycosylase D
MRLSDVAQTLDIELNTLEDLNPSLRYKATPDYPFMLNLPAETSEMFLASLEQIPLWKPPQRAYLVHRVRFGETLSGIALKYHIPVSHIVHANDLRSASRIRAGQRLKIPLRGQIILSSSTPPSDSESTINYMVKRGDSLWLIAQRFNTTVAKIKALNQIQSNFLQTGQLLYVETNAH